MASFNKITIVGYLGRDPELRFTPQGTPVCNFSVATTERRKNADSEQQDHTTWFKITTWNRLAEIAAEYLSKGKQVYVEGRLRLTEYEDREGVTRTQLEVTCSELQFLGSKGDGEDGGRPSSVNEREANNAAQRAALNTQRPTAKAKQQTLPGDGFDGREVINDDEIPF